MPSLMQGLASAQVTGGKGGLAMHAWQHAAYAPTHSHAHAHLQSRWQQLLWQRAAGASRSVITMPSPAKLDEVMKVNELLAKTPEEISDIWLQARPPCSPPISYLFLPSVHGSRSVGWLCHPN